MGAGNWVLRVTPDENRRRVLAAGWWTEQALGQRLAESLSAHRDLPFVVHSATRPWRGTFGELLDLSRRVAGGLSRLGVGVGDVVSFQTPNWIEGVATFYGAALLGAVAAPVVHFYGNREVSYILGQCEPRVHVTASWFGRQDFLANLASIPAPPTMEVVVGQDVPPGYSSFDELAAADPITAAAPADPASPALVKWTSGTTSKPKGVIHSHQTVGAEVQQLGATSPPHDMPVLIANPISHAIGMLAGLVVPVDQGKPVHLLDLWDPNIVLDLMLGENLTTNGGATYFLISLLDHPSFREEHLKNLPYQGMGGSPVPRAVTERATALGINIYRMYGSTEHTSITGCTHVDALEKRLGTDGRPLPGCEVSIGRPRWNRRCLRAGGRDPHSGPGVLLGLYRSRPHGQRVRCRRMVPNR
ncbi:MAG TPA: AMP-binding protein [Acidimicrobiales bacterium]